MCVQHKLSFTLRKVWVIQEISSVSHLTWNSPGVFSVDGIVNYSHQMRLSIDLKSRVLHL